MLSVISLGLLAVSLAISAAFYSIAGLRQFASGAPDAVAILGGTLEVAKLIVAAWLHAVWQDAPRPIRYGGVVFVLAIMLLTMLGIFSFLWSAHQAQSGKIDLATIQQQHIEERLAIHRDSLAVARKDMDALTREYDGFSANGKVSRARAARQEDKVVLDNLRTTIDREQTEIVKIEEEKLRASIATAGRTAELGAARALARLTGGDETSAVNIFISLLMVPFDPLAVWLAIAASYAFTRRNRRLLASGAQFTGNIVDIPTENSSGLPATVASIDSDNQDSSDAYEGEETRQDVAALTDEQVIPFKRGRGRPPGSKNRPKPAPELVVEELPEGAVNSHGNTAITA